MRDFYSFITNGQYKVGCTGQTVYVYDKDMNELAKFKDIIYAYMPMFSPDGTQFIVKSAEGRLAIYSLQPLSLRKKFRFSKVDGGQDDGFCFSSDGKLFLNLERYPDSLCSRISTYETDGFTVISQFAAEKGMQLRHIEQDVSSGRFYVLGFITLFRPFVAEFRDSELIDLTYITEREYDFYETYKSMELCGFTAMTGWKSCVRTHDWTPDMLQSGRYTLANLLRMKREIQNHADA